MDNVRRIKIKGAIYEVSEEKIRQVARAYDPETIREYYVEIEGKRFPPTQLIRLITKATANSNNAKSFLTKLGFTVYFQQKQRRRQND